MILVLGTRKQYEVDAVCTELEKVSSILVVDFLSQNEVSLEPRQDSRGESSLHINDFPLAGARVVWSCPRILTSKFGDTQEWAEEVIAAEQWRAVYRNIQLVMAHKTLNGIDAVNKGYNKLYQLEMAKNAGFAVPPTFLSNSASKLREFINGHDRSITKSLGDPHYPYIENGVYQRAIMTSKVEAEMLNDSAAYEPFPVLLQREIEKKYELRVIVVRKRVIAFRINPFQHQVMNTDYRRGGMMVDYDLIELSDDLQASVLRLNDNLGLFSASYDLIVSPDDTTTFLEVNPFGAWAHLDNLTKGLISKTISSEILNTASVGIN